jgi:16S rRNA (cytosine1402-N4)-methyltransferase
MREQQSGHVSVLVREVLALLALQENETVVDATLGRGGHSEAILKAQKVHLIALDADGASIEAGKKRLKPFAGRVRFVEGNFRDLGAILTREGVQKIDKALFDLGWNSAQLTSGRGFSFQADEPLTMSYGQEPASSFTAAQILNTWSEKGIADALFGYAQERYARKIAKAIVARRETAPIKTTLELVELIKDAVPPSYRHGRIHPATKTFQALRIAVNDELASIEMGVRAAWEHLSPGGRIAVITFHSVEDRAVKRLFAALVKEGGSLLVKKPLVAAAQEVAENPRARSAKLRAIEKIEQ